MTLLAELLTSSAILHTQLQYQTDTCTPDTYKILHKTDIFEVEYTRSSTEWPVQMFMQVFIPTYRNPDLIKH